ncbi:hypothetical protein GIB67_038206 [Kingdonia uniflora]|uniref:Uncharacterized protein n=1 Tax=Kingdonia uniflora TaxID=39325 RepID=A0A7J7NGV5_9MAGN|nr:hypothetical protein GIB67_038206 [Kingdonia uniflora]
MPEVFYSNRFLLHSNRFLVFLPEVFYSNIFLFYSNTFILFEQKLVLLEQRRDSAFFL